MSAPTAAYVAGLEAALIHLMANAPAPMEVSATASKALSARPLSEAEAHALFTPKNAPHASTEDMRKWLDAALFCRPDAPDVRVVTVAQLERWAADADEHAMIKEIRAVIGESK